MAHEIWDLYDANGNKVNRTMKRGDEVPPGLYHIGVHIWPINGRGEFLIQQRSASVQWKPNTWAATGGSAISGENPWTAARRELKEELGYETKDGELCRIACLRRTNSFCNVFVLKTDCDADDFVLQKEEVSAVRWCNPKQMQQMISEGVLYNSGDSYYKMLFYYEKTHR